MHPAARAASHGKGTPDGAEVTLQTHLTQDHGMLKVSIGNLAAGQQEPEGDREIQRGTILAYVRGSQVHGDPPQRKLKAGVRESSGDSLPALLDGPVWQADGREGDHC